MAYENSMSVLDKRACEILSDKLNRSAMNVSRLCAARAVRPLVDYEIRLAEIIRDDIGSLIARFEDGDMRGWLEANSLEQFRVVEQIACDLLEPRQE